MVMSIIESLTSKTAKRFDPFPTFKFHVQVGDITEAAFTELMDFIRTFRFERLGVFPYSHEEDTPAFNNFNDTISER